MVKEFPLHRLERKPQPILSKEEINAVIVITAVSLVIIAYSVFAVMCMDTRLTGF